MNATALVGVYLRHPNSCSYCFQDGRITLSTRGESATRYCTSFNSGRFVFHVYGCVSLQDILAVVRYHQARRSGWCYCTFTSRCTSQAWKHAPNHIVAPVVGMEETGQLPPLFDAHAPFLSLTCGAWAIAGIFSATKHPPSRVTRKAGHRHELGKQCLY